MQEISKKIHKVLSSHKEEVLDYETALKMIGGNEDRYNQLLSRIVGEDESEEKTEVIDIISKIHENINLIKQDENKTLNHWISYKKTNYKYSNLPESFWVDIESKSVELSKVNYFVDLDFRLAQGSYREKNILDTLIESQDETTVNVVSAREESIYKRDLYITPQNFITKLQELTKSRSAKCKASVEALKILHNKEITKEPLVLIYEDVNREISNGEILLSFSNFGKLVTIIVEKKHLIEKTEEFVIYKVKGVNNNFITKKTIPTYVIELLS